MKKHLLKTGIILLGILLVLPFTARGAEGKKLTLMVYMCGSNLESRGGAASADIREMLDSGMDSGEINLLVMTGGSTRWAMGFDAETTMIHEIGSRGMRTVWKSGEETGGALNMGDSGTLAAFMEYCIQRYPAEKFALILWDHGGGPMTGICWDEIFSMSYMTPEGLAEALAQVGFSEWSKLSWIGFDACLMSSVEVACTIAPYAEYMIASEETEPAQGWNYVFLAGLENDDNGAETGRRIIDAYFDGAEGTGDSLTLACTDLKMVSRITQEMDRFFQAQAETVTEEDFPRLSNLRMQSAAFGKGVSGADGESYDLVDLGNLISLLDPENSGALAGAIGDAVVCSRSNTENTAGLSVYHPYRNKRKYTDQWHDGYQRIKSSAGFAEYIFRFGSLLTAGETVDWSGLRAADDGRDDAGTSRYSCRLTPEQAENYASARLLILRESEMNSGEDDSYTLIGTAPAAMDADGTVRAEYGGRTLYIENPEGSAGEQLVGPLGYLLTDDNREGVINALLQRTDTSLMRDLDECEIFFSPDSGGTEAPVRQIRMKDSATGTYTSRIAFREEDYSDAYFPLTLRVMPENSDNGTLPAFAEWPGEKERIESYQFKLGKNWSLRFSDRLLSGSRIMVLFEITDVRQNTFCSAPVSFHNANSDEISMLTGAQENELFRIEAAGRKVASELQNGLEFTFRITNLADENARISVEDLILNGTRTIAAIDTEAFSPGQTREFILDAGRSDLVFLTELHSAGTKVRWESIDDWDQETVREMVFDVAETDLSGIAREMPVLAGTEEGGVLWQLLDISVNDDGDLELLLHAADRRGREADTPEAAEYTVAVNGLLVDNDTVTLQAGADQILTATVSNDVTAIGIGWVTSDVTDLFRSLVLSNNVQSRHGHDTLKEITITECRSGTGSAVNAALYPEPRPIPAFTPTNQNSRWYAALEKANPERAELTTLIDWPAYTISAERVFAGDNGFIICLEITNRTDLNLCLAIEDPEVNGEPIGFVPGFTIPPRLTLLACLSAVTEDYLPDVREISSFSFRVTGAPQAEDPEIRITFAEPLKLGTAGGAMLEHDAIRAEAPAAPEIPAQGKIPTGVTFRAEAMRYTFLEDAEWENDTDRTMTVRLNEDGTAEVNEDVYEWTGCLWTFRADGAAVLRHIGDPCLLYPDGESFILSVPDYAEYRLVPAEEP